MNDCPCGSGRPYSDCCRRYISGTAKPPTAEALMRSRYSAYVEHEIDYIINTCRSRDRDTASSSDAQAPIDYKSTRDWSEQSTWLGLKIISTEKGGVTDTEGTVEFEASYIRDGLKDIHHERAKFTREGTDTQWLYDEGYVTPVTVVRSGPKTGRNAPCPCGSGKKYKHCCLNK